MAGRTDRRLRMGALIVVFTILGGATMLRLGYWQIIRAGELVAEAQPSLVKPDTAQLARAEIVDRDGVTLAQSTSLDNLNVNPELVPEDRRPEVLDALARIMGLDPVERAAWAAKLASQDDPWERLARQLTPEQSAEIALARENGELPGITLEPEDVRSYPRSGGVSGTTLASQLLGFVDADGRGGSGIESAYDDRLTGKATSPADLASIADLPGGLDGTDVPPLRLTIDAKLQKQLEKELNTARLADRAKSASAIIMDPYSGAILASASVPGYDANDYAAVASRSMGRLRNSVVSDVFEPGSVMKMFTVTAALDAGVVTPRTKINDPPQLDLDGRTIHNADWKGMGPKSVEWIIGHSRNLGTAKIAMRLSPDTQKAARRLYQTWERLGLVGKTGVDIAAEATGLYPNPKDQPWVKLDLANRAFGQGVAVTLMQLATGYSTIVNGGFRIQPHVAATDAAEPQRKRVLSAKVDKQAMGIMEFVTGGVSYYAKGALIPHYTIGGKTGTAQIWDPSKGKDGDWKNTFNHNFVGFVGGDKPAVVIAVRIEEAKPKVCGQGCIDLKIESYELFNMIAHAAINRLHIRKSSDPNAGLPILGTEAAAILTPHDTAASRRQRFDAGRSGQSGQRTKRDQKQKRKQDQEQSRERPGAKPGRGGSGDQVDVGG